MGTGTAHGLSSAGYGEHWQTSAACGSEHPEVMYPLPGNVHAIRQAQLVCEPCTVKAKCLAQSYDLRDWDGVRAGYTGIERAMHFKSGIPLGQWPAPVGVFETFTCKRCEVECARDPKRPFVKFCPACTGHPAGGRKHASCRDCKQRPATSPRGRCEDCAGAPARMFAGVS